MVNLIKRIKQSRLIKGFIATLFGSGMSKVILVVATFVCSNMLGKMAFGEMSFVRNTLNMVLCICALNFSSLCTKFTTESSESDDSLHRLFLLFLFSLGISIFLGLFLVIAPTPLLMNALSTETIVRFFRIAGLLLPLFILQPLIEGVFRGLKLFNLIGVVQVLTSLAYLICVAIGIKIAGLNGALYGVIIYYSLYSIICLYLLYTKTTFRYQILRLKGFGKQASVIWTMILPVFLMSFIDAPVLWFAQVVLSKSGSMESVGSMTAMMQIRNLAMLIPGYFTNTYLSFAGDLNAKKDYCAYYRQFAKIERYYLVIGLSGFAVLSVLAPIILSLYGKEFMSDWPVMIVSNMCIPFYMMVSIYRMDLILKERQRYLLFGALVWNSIWVALLLVFVKFGMNALLSFFLSNAIATIVNTALLYAKYRKDKTDSCRMYNLNNHEE